MISGSGAFSQWHKWLRKKIYILPKRVEPVALWAYSFEGQLVQTQG